MADVENVVTLLGLSLSLTDTWMTKSIEHTAEPKEQEGERK